MEPATIFHVPTEGKTEGAKLEALLERTGVGKAELGAGVGVSGSAVTKWVKAIAFEDRQWDTVRRALLAAGLDPTEIRAEPVRLNRDRALTMPAEDLWPAASTLLSKKADEPERLQALKRILEASDLSRRDLLNVIRGQLLRG